MSIIEVGLIVSLFLLTPWVLFSLLAALLDATVGFLDEYLLKKLASGKARHIDAPGRLVLISGLFGFVVTGVACILAYTLNVSLSTNGVYLGIVAGILEVLWLIPYFYALHKGGAISTTPLFQTIPIFSLFLGLLIFGEIPIVQHILATIIIVIGAVVLNYSPSNKTLNLYSISLMLLASAIISTGYFIFKDAATGSNLISAIVGNGLGMGVFSTLVYILYTPYRHQLNDFIRHVDFKILLLQGSNEALYSFHTFFTQLALVLGPSVMLVSAFNAFHPIFTLLIGILLAKLGSISHKQELQGIQSLTKTLGILLIALGTVLIALS